MPELHSSPKVYISYAWGNETEAIIEKIENKFHQNGITIIRDKRDLKYKGMIRDFMTQLGRGRYVILMLNNEYFQSENCMFELLQIFKNQQFHDRIFPVVLDELKIYKAQDRVKLIKYWENQTKGLESEIRKLKELSNIHGVSDDLDLYTEIRNTIATLTSSLSDINTLTLEQHLKSNFDELLQRVREKIRQDNLTGDNGHASAISVNVVKIAIIALVLVTAGIFLIIYLRPTTPDHTKIAEIKDETSQVADAPDSSNQESGSVQESEIDQPETESPENTARISYEVRIIVPSDMMNGTVLVDGEPAEILSRNLTFITVRVNQKSGSHHFRIENGNNNCTTDQLIQRDGITLAMCD